MEICTESAPQACVSGCSGDAAEYSGAWIGGAYRRVPAREPLGLGAGRHLSLFPAAAAHTPVLAQPDISSGREEDMVDESPHVTVQVATTQGASDMAGFAEPGPPSLATVLRRRLARECVACRRFFECCCAPEEKEHRCRPQQRCDTMRAVAFFACCVGGV